MEGGRADAGPGARRVREGGQRRARAHPAGPVRPGSTHPGRRAQPDPDDEAPAGPAGDADRHQRADRAELHPGGRHFAILHDAERVIADPIVRNWGTVGGSLCQADPSEDLSAAFAALKATMVIDGPDGSREVSARAFHTGPYETVVGPAEMLTEIRLPVRPGSGSAYLKVMRRAGDWPISAAGAAVWLAGGQITDVGIGLTAVGAAGFVAAEAEEFLRGRVADEPTLARAGEIAAGHCRPASDQRGPAEYKRHLVQELTTRVLRIAVRRAGELAS